ncbi:MAG: hypothetical protein KIT62_06100 [Cyclobacteriaceae bacterium]|nr:hypothetical protein [Cyclobacteriaceae bacterium]
MKTIVMILTLCGLFDRESFAQQNNIVGTWAIDISESVANLSMKEKNAYSGLPDKTKQTIGRLFDGRVFRFDTNGEVLIKYPTSSNSKTVTGEWLLNQNNEQLSIKALQATIDYRLHWMNADTVILEVIKPGDNSIINSLYLRRQN